MRCMIFTAVGLMLLGAAAVRAQEAPAKVYWSCSILVPASLEPPVIDYIIADIFQDETPKAELDAAKVRHAAAIMDAAKARGLSLASGVPDKQASPYCMALEDERQIQAYRLKLFASEAPGMGVRRHALAWAPASAIAVASDPVPPLPPAGKPGKIGVSLQGLNKNLAQHLGVPISLGFSDTADGALLSDVAQDGTARRSGLQIMDVVMEIEGRKVTSPEDFINIVSAQRPGSVVSMSIIRFGETKTMDVLVGE